MGQLRTSTLFMWTGILISSGRFYFFDPQIWKCKINVFQDPEARKTKEAIEFFTRLGNRYNISHVAQVREAPLRKLQGLFGHYPNGGGGLNACPDGLGHLFREELSMFQGAFACFWGVWTLARMVWGTYAVNIEVPMAFAQVGPEIKCPRVPAWGKGGGGFP